MDGWDRRSARTGRGFGLFVSLAGAILLSTASLAQQAPTPEASPAPATSAVPVKQVGTPATVVDEGQVSSLLGRSVQSPTGEDMGRVVDLLVDTAGEVRAAVVDFGGFFGVGSRKIAIDWHALHFKPDGKAGTIVADLPANQLRTSPIYKEGEPIVIVGRSTTVPDAKPAVPTAPPEPVKP